MYLTYTLKCTFCGSLKTKEREEEEPRNALLESSGQDDVKQGEELSENVSEDFQDEREKRQLESSPRDNAKQGEELTETSLPDFDSEMGKQQEEVLGRSLVPEEDPLRAEDGEQGDEQMSMLLPEDLVGSVLSMVPFPHVFKMQTLSKTWRARFSPVSSEDDEDKSIFQKQVSAISPTWTTYCPVFVGKENLMSYDRSSSTWRKHSLFALPKNFLSRHKRSIVQVEGALLLVSAWLVSVSLTDIQEYAVYFYRSSSLRGKSGEQHLYVGNLLTKTWKQLPPIPRVEGYSFVEKPSSLDAKLINQTSSGTYTVVVFYAHLGHCLAQIYESSSGVWNQEMFSTKLPMEFLSYHAYLNGVFYRAVLNKKDMSWGLLAFTVEDCSFEVLTMMPIDVPMQFGLIDLVVCNGTLILVSYNNFYTVESVIVHEVDPESRRTSEVTRGPPAALNFGNLQKHPASDGECLFFASTTLAGTLAYNLRENEWYSFPNPDSVVQSHFSHVDSTREYDWTSSSFQPGLNPFMPI